MYRRRAQTVTIVEETIQGRLETLLVQLTAPVLVSLHVVVRVGLVHLFLSK